MNHAYLLLGSNIGVREEQLENARKLLNVKCGKIVAASAIYETAAWGKTDQADFLNQALHLETSLNSRQLIRTILKTEKEMGRVRKDKFDPRIIDIDILLFNNEIRNYSFLKLPHPELKNRRFALLPLAEIAADLIHPVLQTSIHRLLEICSDPLDVRKFT